MRKKILRRVAAAGLIGLLTFGMAFYGQLGILASTTKDAENTSLEDAEREKKALEQELADAQQTIKELKESQGNVADKVAELNGQLLDISARITTLENQLTQKNNEIVAAQEQLADAQEQLADAQADQEQQYEDMKVRIRYMYENSQTTYIQQLLASGDISEFLNTAEYITQIELYDRQKLEEYAQTVENVKALVASITDMEAQLEQDYADLETMKATVETEKEAVAALMRQKEIELAGISGEIDSTQDDIDYYEAEIQAQEELIAEIRRLEAEKAAAGVTDNPYSGGVFTWPCPSSTIISSDYGMRESPIAGASTNHNGIDIAAGYGSDIVAAAGGTVRAATYSSSCGNYVMIDHGGGLYTIYMHASSLCVSAGDTVTAGQVIAKVGSTGISTGNHLHFGVSLNGSYVNPWGYF